MAFSFLSWIWIIYQELVGVPHIPKRPREPLPDDLIIDILIRLPAKQVLQCRRVCMEWKSLISTTPYFREHLKRATPQVIVSHITYSRTKEEMDMELYLVDEWGDTSKKVKPRTRSICASTLQLEGETDKWPTLSFSYDGLLVFMSPAFKKPRTSIIFNPVTQDKITLYNREGEICGLFFHPIAREYRALWVGPCRRYVEFKILSLRKETFWRPISNFTCCPRTAKPPVILNDALHWITALCCPGDGVKRPASCSQLITIFDLVKEEFRAMPHPGGLDSKCNSSHRLMHLLHHEGYLSLYELSRFPTVVDIWILEDYENWIWTKRHSINLKLDSYFKPCTCDLEKTMVKPLGVQNEALLFLWRRRGLFAYHLQQKTLKIFEKDKDSIHVDAWLHTNSLVSLRNFPAEIFMPYP